MLTWGWRRGVVALVVALVVGSSGTAGAADGSRELRGRTTYDPAGDQNPGPAWRNHPGLHKEADLRRTRFSVVRYRHGRSVSKRLVAAYRLQQLDRPNHRTSLQITGEGTVEHSGHLVGFDLVSTLGGRRPSGQTVATLGRHQLCPGAVSTGVALDHSQVVVSLPLSCLPRRSTLHGIFVSVRVAVNNDDVVGGDTSRHDWSLHLRS